MCGMSGDQFGADACPQISTADQILAEDRRAGAAACSCARRWPCPVVVSCEQTRGHFQSRLARLEAAVRLRVAPAAQPTAVVCRRRLGGAVFGGGRS